MSVKAKESGPRNHVPEAQPNSLPTVPARITYFFSEQGRRESLRRGGDGRARQEVTVSIPAEDLEFFTVSLDGTVTLDLTESYHVWGDNEYKAPANKAHWTVVGDEDGEVLEWDVVPE